MKNLWEYKLDLLYYGISIEKKCYNFLRKGIDGKVNNDDYITTKGLFIILNDSVHVNANINPKSPYIIDRSNNKFVLKHDEEIICDLDIIQPPDYALYNSTLDNGILISTLVNIHGDRIRIQPIQGCANRCTFCDINKYGYYRHSIEDLNAAFTFAKEFVGFRHALISGGSPKTTKEDYEYLNDVYKFFGENYGTKYPIDVMLTPRGLTPDENTEEGYKKFLLTLKSWNITGLSINLELYNDELRKKYIPQKEMIGKDNYYLFIKLAVLVFGKKNVRSCVLVGLEDISDTLKAVDEISKLGCMPVLSPYIPNDDETSTPTPEVMKEVLLKSEEIVTKNNSELGPICDSCKHNTIHFK